MVAYSVSMKTALLEGPAAAKQIYYNWYDIDNTILTLLTINDAIYYTE